MHFVGLLKRPTVPVNSTKGAIENTPHLPLQKEYNLHIASTKRRLITSRPSGVEPVESHHATENLVVNPQVIVSMVLNAHEFFKEKKIDERYEKMALDLIRRYVSTEGLPREEDPFFAAALYMVTRHPWSHPNPLTKSAFAIKLNMKESSIEWYTESITEKLDFYVLHDSTQLPFFMDSQGIIASVVESVVRTTVGEEVASSIINRSVDSPDYLTEKIVDQLCNTVKIVPAVFEQELHTIVRKKIDFESKRLFEQLNRS